MAAINWIAWNLYVRAMGNSSNITARVSSANVAIVAVHRGISTRSIHTHLRIANIGHIASQIAACKTAGGRIIVASSTRTGVYSAWISVVTIHLRMLATSSVNTSIDGARIGVGTVDGDKVATATSGIARVSGTSVRIITNDIRMFTSKDSIA
jgi:hypothetical protein